MGPHEQPRYRHIDDTYYIDLRVRQVRQLFDLRDPAPFKERDLDPGVVEYIESAIEELPDAVPVHIAIFIADEAEPTIANEDLLAAMQSYFAHAQSSLNARMRAHWRQGQITLLVGLSVLAFCLFGSRAVAAEKMTPLRELLREGLTIGGWVALWRPAEHFLYDWWPFLAERRKLRRITEAKILVHWGERGPSL